MRSIKVAPGRTLCATPVFDTYWKFAVARQRIYMSRVAGESPPWTEDPILREYRFTNVYRASDRVSQYLIKHVQYSGDQEVAELVFRTLLFKLFNRISTWQALEQDHGPLIWSNFDVLRFNKTLDRLMAEGNGVYSGAYIMPTPPLGSRHKHGNHLQLLRLMMQDDLPAKLADAPNMRSMYDILLGYPSLGPFLAFQFTIDVNYSVAADHPESDFVVAGPGARSGIRKCFADSADFEPEEIIQVVADLADKEFERQGLDFPGLWGRRLQLIDCQNLFCEVDKYARVAHPEYPGSGRHRIKRRFRASDNTSPPWFPPSWRVSVTATPTSARDT